MFPNSPFFKNAFTYISSFKIAQYIWILFQEHQILDLSLAEYSSKKHNFNSVYFFVSRLHYRLYINDVIGKGGGVYAKR